MSYWSWYYMYINTQQDTETKSKHRKVDGNLGKNSKRAHCWLKVTVVICWIWHKEFAFIKVHLLTKTIEWALASVDQKLLSVYVMIKLPKLVQIRSVYEFLKNNRFVSPRSRWSFFLKNIECPYHIARRKIFS